MSTSSLEVLKRSLATNGLPTSGSKDEMLKRFILNKGDQCTTARPVQTEDVLATSAFDVYAKHERETLLASGFTSDKSINDEIRRRWSFVSGATSSPTMTLDPPTMTLDERLDVSDESASGHKYAGQTSDGKHMYIKKIEQPKLGKKAPTPSQKSAIPTAEPESSARAVYPPRKRPREDEAQKYRDFAFRRLVDKVHPDNIGCVLSDFAVDTTGMSKEKMAEMLVLQLSYETDNDTD